MIIENLSTLKIHKLTQEQYDREREAGNLDANALYLTPDEETEQIQSDWSQTDDTKADYIKNKPENIMTYNEVDTLPETANEGDVYAVKKETKKIYQDVLSSSEGFEVATDYILCRAYNKTEVEQVICEAIELAGGYPANIVIIWGNTEITFKVNSYTVYDNVPYGGPYEAYFYGSLIEGQAMYIGGGNRESITIGYIGMENKPHIYCNGEFVEFIPDLSNFATEDYVDTKVAEMVDSAPETLNTLNELAQALGDNPNFATTIATQIGNKADAEHSHKILDMDDYDYEMGSIWGTINGISNTLVDKANSDLSNISNVAFKAKAEDAGIGSTSGGMDFKGEVSSLPETANEGEMYTVSSWNKLGSYTNNDGMVLHSGGFDFSTWDTLSNDLYSHIPNNHNGTYKFIIDGQTYLYTDVGISGAGEEYFNAFGQTTDVSQYIPVANGATVEVYWLAAGMGAELTTYVYYNGEFVKTSKSGGVLSVVEGGTGKSTFEYGTVLIGNGTEPFAERYITNNTYTASSISANNYLITSNTLRYAINRTTSVAAADTNYSTYMARGMSLNSTEKTPTANGTIAWTYE